MAVIQVSNAYSGDVLDILLGCAPEGFEVRVLPEATQEALLGCVAGADYLLASGRVRIDKAVLAAAQKLRMVQRTGVGLDSLDLTALAARGIPLYVNQGVNAQSVAEHTLLLILASLRNLCQIARATQAGVWRKQDAGIRTHELCGRTVGIVGMGSIGRKVATLVRAFGANVVYTDAFRMTPDAEVELGAIYATLDELLACSDVVTLHCPLTPDTRHMVRAETLALMKDGVVLVNTARGGLVCEADLLVALREGKVGAAALDVHEREPMSPDDPLLACENVICTPHVGGITHDSFSRMMRDAMRNIALFHAGELEAIEPYRHRG